MAGLDGLQLVAFNLIEKFGNTNAVFTEPGILSYDPSTQITTNPGDTSHSWKITPPTPFVRERSLLSTDTNAILTTLIAAKDIPFVPAVKMSVTLAGQEYMIDSIAPIYSGDLIAVYELGLIK